MWTDLGGAGSLFLPQITWQTFGLTTVLVLATALVQPGNGVSQQRSDLFSYCRSIYCQGWKSPDLCLRQWPQLQSTGGPLGWGSTMAVGGPQNTARPHPLRHTARHRIFYIRAPQTPPLQ